MITSANLIVATAHNTMAMNHGLKQVAEAYISGHEVTEGMLNRMEGLIRSFDPCLSCATHADGTMDLIVEVVDAEGKVQQKVARKQ